MNRSVKKLIGTAILIIAAMTVLAACASAQTAPQAATAAQLAAALNAMNEGSARMSGNTVTLTRNVGVQGNLTVPAGVTLELTADGGLYLRDNVTLTVNGTVNAPNGKIGYDGDAGARMITINGNGTIYLTGKRSLFNIDNGRKLTLDGVTLVGVPDNDESLVTVNNGGELVLVSGAITGNTSISEEYADAGGVRVARGTFTMSGGAIYGNTAQGSVRNFGGGGVKLNEGATFTMSGGRIQGGTASDGYAANTLNQSNQSAAIEVSQSTARWGTGGTYTRGGVNQSGGSNIASTNDTLIAIPAR